MQEKRRGIGRICEHRGTTLLAFVALGLMLLPMVPAEASSGPFVKNMTYCTVGGVALKMDLYYPSPSISGPYKVIVFIHGGGWQSGDKSGITSPDYAFLMNLRNVGFLVVSVNYRLAPNYTAPAQVEDVKCAIRFLKAHALGLNLDARHFGVYGLSAGGHLADLVGLTKGNVGWDVGQWLKSSSQVQAVVDVSGPTNLSATQDFGPTGVSAIAQAFTTPQDMWSESPVNQIHPSAVKFLLLYGLNDTLVSFGQGVALYDSLQLAGVSSTLVLVNNAGHGLAPIGSPSEAPSQVVWKQQIAAFFVASV